MERYTRLDLPQVHFELLHVVCSVPPPSVPKLIINSVLRAWAASIALSYKNPNSTCPRNID
jgi:hypothetical protein